jgi:hypothetical protein
MQKILLTLLLSLLPLFLTAQAPLPVVVSPAGTRRPARPAARERLQTLLPGLMRQAGVSMWLLIGREYHEDPVLKTMLPATWLSAAAPHRAGGVRPGTGKGIGMPGRGPLQRRFGVQERLGADKEPDQWKRLVQLIEERQPRNIALNFSEEYAHADGITHSEYAQLMQYLPETYRGKVVSGEKLAVGGSKPAPPPKSPSTTTCAALPTQSLPKGSPKG